MTTEENYENISIKEIMNNLLETSIFRNIAQRTNEEFVQKLAVWLIRYVMFIVSMNESLGINLEEILFNLHGENFRRILEVIESVMSKVAKNLNE
jgi:hypothetical protein